MLNIDYGLNEYVVEFQGVQREYIIYVPESYLPENTLPLVFVMHGLINKGYLIGLFLVIFEFNF